MIGDVSGKGAPAAIYAGVVAGILRSHAPMEPAPAEMLTAVNYSLVERRIDAQFVSLIYCIWDDANLTLQVANSGLPRPVYCHKGKTQMIEATGLPLGLFEDAEYDEFVFQAEPDEFLFSLAMEFLTRPIARETCSVEPAGKDHRGVLIAAGGVDCEVHLQGREGPCVRRGDVRRSNCSSNQS